MDLSCRFYANHYPGVGDVVMVNVTSIGDMGVYVHLLEFNNMNGIIQLSEITRRRIRSIHKLVKVNRNEVAVVLRVDEEKGTHFFFFLILSRTLYLFVSGYFKNKHNPVF